VFGGSFLKNTLTITIDNNKTKYGVTAGMSIELLKVIFGNCTKIVAGKDT
jgi:hypothetical protein